jgi:hypothetical protein
MITCCGVELAAEIVREKISRNEDKGRVRQHLCHLPERRSEQRPTGIFPVTPEGRIARLLENLPPLFRLGTGQPIDEPRIGHRIEMEIGHYQGMPGSRGLSRRRPG